MDKVRAALRYLGYALIAGIFYLFAQEYAWIGYAAGAAWIGFVIHEIVKEAVRTVLQEELRSLREQSYANTERLETIDRKVSAVWNRIRAISAG